MTLLARGVVWAVALLVVPAASPTTAAPAVPAAASVDLSSEDRQRVGERAASQALARARALFGRDDGARRTVLSTQDPTLVMRDLAAARPSLGPDDRRVADRLLARPDDGDGDVFGDGYTVASQRTCTTLCVHWVESTPDAVPRADSDGDGTPTYVEQALGTLRHVRSAYLTAGYRPPKADDLQGGNSLFDVYLVDIGDDSIYGYCVPDGPGDPTGQTSDRSGYCVLDNDYRPAQFPQATPLANLRVTAAHEYFHAVQFGYDSLEDAWLMESTATWAEAEIYPALKDNLQYLRHSPLTRPRLPIDSTVGGFYYGTWIFVRYLSERWPAERGVMPTIVRDIWNRAESVNGPRADRNGVEAVRGALAARGTTWPRVLSRFAAGNRRPARTYRNGAADRYPSAPLWGSVSLSRRAPATRFARPRLDHLSSATVRFTPTRSLRARGWKLRLVVDLPARFRGPAALATVVRRSGSTSTTSIRLSARGNGSVRVPFSRSTVQAVELTVANGSTRDNNLVHALRGVAVR